MIRALSAPCRPFGVAFGAFIFLNLALAVQRPQLAVTSIWLEADLPEPWLSLFAGLLGVCLVVPHEAAKASWVRWILGGVFAGFAVLTLIGTATFYYELHTGGVATDLPVPLSALLCGVLISEFARVSWWAPRRAVTPPPARLFLSGVGVSVAFLLLTLAHVVTFGRTDFRSRADAAVVFGAKVYADGTPSTALRARLETARALFADGLVHHVVVTGGRGPNGWSEPAVMRDYLVRGGVPRSRIHLDEGGHNTRASAVGCRAIAERNRWKRLLAVTQYFHCARVKMIFEREGISCSTVPAFARGPGQEREGTKLSREGFFLMREAVAFPFYLLYYR